jgi:hypothetical protein
MSNEDSFIQEVSDEVRKDQLYATFRKYGWIAGLVVVTLVGGAAWNEWRKSQARAEAQGIGDAILTALEAETPEGRVSALDAIAGNESTQKVLDLMVAAEAASVDDKATAKARLEAVVADQSLSNIYRDLATLKLVMVEGEDLAAPDRIERLQPLIIPGAPYRLSALEIVALAEVEQGNTDAALTILQDIIADSEASGGLRQRASQLIVALGGSIEAT